jgi:hypothetical protein|tara:strand:- start:286 stop:618 length:333 start_codon:yes stop_codon:yes gene_type:complete
MMELFFGLLLLVSLAVNITLIWYIKWVVARSSVTYEATDDILSALQDFVEHLDTINELRDFYGDPDFKDVLEHAKNITEDIANYKDGFIFETKGETIEHSYSAEEATTEE